MSRFGSSGSLVGLSFKIVLPDPFELGHAGCDGGELGLVGAVGDIPAAALGGFEAQAEVGKPALGIGAVGCREEFGPGQCPGCRLKRFGLDRSGLFLDLAHTVGLRAMADELAEIATAVVQDALFAAYAAIFALIGFGPAREAEAVVGEAGQAAVFGRDARGHDMQMRMVAVLMDDHEGLAIGKADLGHGGTAGLEHGGMVGLGLIGRPGENEMGDQVLGLPPGRLDAGCGFEGLGIGGGLCHARPSGIGALAVEEVGGVEAQIDGGDGGDPIAGLVVQHILGRALDGTGADIAAGVRFRLEHVLGGSPDGTAEDQLRDHGSG